MKWLVVFFEGDNSFSAIPEKKLINAGRLYYDVTCPKKIKVDFYGDSSFYDGIVVAESGM